MENFKEVKELIETIQEIYNSNKGNIAYDILHTNNIIEYNILHLKDNKLNSTGFIYLNNKESKDSLIKETKYLKEKYGKF